MQASNDTSNDIPNGTLNENAGTRHIVVEFAATVFLVISIGIAVSIVLAGAVLLLAGDGRNAAGTGYMTETVPAQPKDAHPDAALQTVRAGSLP